MSLLEVGLFLTTVGFFGLWLLEMARYRTLFKKFVLISSNYKADLEAVTVTLMQQQKIAGMTMGSLLPEIEEEELPQLKPKEATDAYR